MPPATCVFLSSLRYDSAFIKNYSKMKNYFGQNKMQPYPHKHLEVLYEGPAACWHHCLSSRVPGSGGRREVFGGPPSVPGVTAGAGKAGAGQGECQLFVFLFPFLFDMQVNFSVRENHDFIWMLSIARGLVRWPCHPAVKALRWGRQWWPVVDWIPADCSGLWLHGPQSVL